DRNARRIGSNERDARVDAGAADLLAPDAQHRLGEIDADDESGRRPGRAGGERDVGGTGAQIDDALPAGEVQGRDGAPPPPAIDPGAEQVIEEIVPGRNRVE